MDASFKASQVENAVKDNARNPGKPLPVRVDDIDK